jgi:NDP-4-keto-2,6-dideoxyhexose 3-C-methyltransferase
MIQQCRVCSEDLRVVLDMGHPSLSDFPSGNLVDVLDELAKTRTPLCLCQCTACGLVQLGTTVDPDTMFRQYWYQSGINETMREELNSVVYDSLVLLGGLSVGDVVVDVGANDGTLLAFHPRHIKRVAYEPARNLQETLAPHCDVLCADYFPGPESVRRTLDRKVKVLTSIACFYATSDPAGFVRAVDEMLTDDGLWVVQFQDLYQMLRAVAFDDICHEHVFYPCLASVERLLTDYDLHVVDAQWRAINGGSMRLTIGRRHRAVSPNVHTVRTQESGCESDAMLQEFSAQVIAVRDQLRKTVIDAVSAGKTIDLYGASTKGNTLLQFCDLGPPLIRQAWERSEAKWDRRTATGIPIVSEEDGRSSPPDLLLVLIWQFRDAVIKREIDYLAGGGTLLFPLPSVHMVKS